MARVALILGLAALLGCGEPVETTPDAGGDAGVEGPRETNCVNRADDDGDDLVDCADPDCATDTSCRPKPPKPCNRQSDCGYIVDELVTKCCLPKSPVSDEPPGALRCFAPGEAEYDGDPIDSSILFALVFDNAFAQSPSKPKTAVVRLLYPEKIDGSPLRCAEVLTLNGTNQDTRSRLDENGELNQVFRSLYTLTWGGSNTVFRNIIASVPRGQSFVLYGEAWYGERDLNNPTGNRAASFCREGMTVDESSINQHFELSFKPNT